MPFLAYTTCTYIHMYVCLYVCTDTLYLCMYCTCCTYCTVCILYVLYVLYIRYIQLHIHYIYTRVGGETYILVEAEQLGGL